MRPVLNRALALALALPAMGCGGVLTRIDIDGSAQTEIVGASLVEVLAEDLGFGELVSMDLTQADELQNQGVEPGDIKEARLVSFELEAIEPADADLSFLDAMTLLVSAPGLPEEVVASAPGFPQGEAVVVFDLEEVDLTEYIVSESMTLTTDVSGQRPDRATRIEARYVVEVGVTVKGATRKRD